MDRSKFGVDISHNCLLITSFHREFGDIVRQQTVRKAIVANALWCEGLRAGVKEEREKFESMLGELPSGAKSWDLDRPFSCKKIIVADKRGVKKVSYQTMGLSTCGLVADEILARSGLKVPWRGQPYKIGSAIARTVAWGKSVGIYDNDIPTRAGDYLVLGGGLGAHACIVVDVHGSVYETVDGGGVDREHRSLQCITSNKRLLKQKSGKYYMGTKEFVGCIHSERIVDALLDVYCCVPENWRSLQIS